MRPFDSYDAYRSAWAEAHTIDPPVPLNIDLELVSACNLACPFCFWGERDFAQKMSTAGWDGLPRKRMMPLALVRKLLDQASDVGVPAIKINWRGESTLHPQFTVVMEHAASRQPKFHDLLINTNGNCPEHALPGLLYATKIMVSLDSMNEATYARMRVHGDLARAIETVEFLLARGHKNVWVRRVITRENKTEPFPAQVKAMFGEGVKVSEHFCFDRNADEKHEPGEGRVIEAFGRTYCGYPSQRIMVSSSGLCYPCCVDYDETMPVGNAVTQTLLEIWNGEPMRRLRAALRENDVHRASATCANCTSWMAYEAPQRAFVQDREAKP